MSPRVRWGMGWLVLASLLACAWPVHAQSHTARLFVAALDRAGTPVTDLEAADFDIKENGASCPVVRARLGTDPMRIALLVDNSDVTLSFLGPLRQGLARLVGGLSPDIEVALVTIGRAFAVRVPPTLDRQKLQSAVRSLYGDPASGTMLAQSLLETEARFFRGADRWPIFVIVTADQGENTTAIRQVDFDQFTNRLQTSAATVHAVLLSLGDGRITDALVRNLTRDTRGSYDAITKPGELPERLAAVAARIEDDRRRMAEEYEIEYTSGSAAPNPSIEIGVKREGVTLTPSDKRVR